ncbi:MAG: hypothetical protein CBE43_00160, partial [Rhodopirellula sp. TMED283]
EIQRPSDSEAQRFRGPAIQRPSDSEAQRFRGPEIQHGPGDSRWVAAVKNLPIRCNRVPNSVTRTHGSVTLGRDFREAYKIFIRRCLRTYSGEKAHLLKRANE